MTKKPIAFLDADIILHRAVSCLDDDFDGEPVDDWRTALKYFEWIKNKWLKEVGKYEDYFLILSVGKTFRHDIYPDYKGNRKNIVPHPSLHSLKQEVMEIEGSVWEEGIEADDLIGIRASEDPKNHLAVSADKDFATVPCRLMIPTAHGRKKPDWHSFTKAEADRNFLIQAMSGDTIDNYHGIYGIGDKKAADIVDNPRLTEKAPTEYFKRGPRKGQPKPDKWVDGAKCSVWQSMVSTAHSKGMSESELTVMAQLAHILRDGDYDFETKRVKLWQPNTAQTTKSETQWFLPSVRRSGEDKKKT